MFKFRLTFIWFICKCTHIWNQRRILLTFFSKLKENFLLQIKRTLQGIFKWKKIPKSSTRCFQEFREPWMITKNPTENWQHFFPFFFFTAIERTDLSENHYWEQTQEAGEAPYPSPAADSNSNCRHRRFWSSLSRAHW